MINFNYYIPVVVTSDQHCITVIMENGKMESIKASKGLLLWKQLLNFQKYFLFVALSKQRVIECSWTHSTVWRTEWRAWFLSYLQQPFIRLVWSGPFSEYSVRAPCYALSFSSFAFSATSRAAQSWFLCPGRKPNRDLFIDSG